MPYDYAQPLPFSGPPFGLWIAPSDLIYTYRLVVDSLDDPLYEPDTNFIDEQG